MKHTILSSILFLACASGAWAEDDGRKWLLGMGFDTGGEKISTIYFSGGGSEDIRTHEGLIVNTGLSIPLNNNLEARATVGYKFDSVNASNGKASFDRIPIELLAFKAMNLHRLGGGILYHTAVENSCNITAVCNFSVPIKDTLGWIIQYEYELKTPAAFLNANLTTHLGLRYSSTSYEPESGGTRLQANGIGLIAYIAF